MSLLVKGYGVDVPGWGCGRAPFPRLVLIAAQLRGRASGSRGAERSQRDAVGALDAGVRERMIGRWGPGRFGDGGQSIPRGVVTVSGAGQAAAMRPAVLRPAVVVRPGRSGR